MRILLVEDDEQLRASVGRGLREAGHEVDEAGDGETALRSAGSGSYDCIVLDILLPDRDGIEVCRELRSEGNWVPILMLTALGSVEDRIRGLDAGADDYLPKPFYFDELLARVRATTRRGKEDVEERIDVGDLVIDTSRRSVRRGDRTVELTAREFAFLVGGEYVDQSSVGKGARDFSDRREGFIGTENRIVLDGSSAPPTGNFATSMGRMTVREGEDGDEISDYRQWIGDNTAPNTDRFNFNPFEDLQQPSERVTLFGEGRHRFMPELRLFGEAFYHHRDSRTQIAPLPFFTTREEGVVVSEDHVYNPFGETITDARRRMVEAGTRTFTQDNEAYRVVGGVDGVIDGWRWDASLTHGRNETVQHKRGEFLDSRVARALGPSFINDQGEAVCGTPGDPIPDCVPLDIFGGPGSVTEEMLDYVSADLTDTGFNEQTAVNANLSGSLLSLPAGSLAVAAG